MNAAATMLRERRDARSSRESETVLNGVEPRSGVSAATQLSSNQPGRAFRNLWVKKKKCDAECLIHLPRLCRKSCNLILQNKCQPVAVVLYNRTDMPSTWKEGMPAPGEASEDTTSSCLQENQMVLLSCMSFCVCACVRACVQTWKMPQRWGRLHICSYCLSASFRYIFISPCRFLVQDLACHVSVLCHSLGSLLNLLLPLLQNVTLPR